MRTVTIKNSTIVSNTFWASLNSLMNVTQFDGKTTLGLFNARKQLLEKVEDIQAISKSADQGIIKEVLEEETEIWADFVLDAEKLAGHLSANDLFQLEILFHKEES